MLHIYMNLSSLMVYAKSIEEFKLERRGRSFKREKEPIGKTNLGLRRELQIKISLMLLRLTMRGVVILKMLNLLALLVEISTLGSV